MFSRAIRHLFTLLSLACLILCLGISVFWYRSYDRSERVMSRSASGSRNLYSRQGHLVFYMLHADWSNQPASFFGVEYDHDQPATPSNDLSMRSLLCTDTNSTEFFWQRGSFAWWERRKPGGALYLMAVAPFWSLALLTGFFPVASLGLHVRSRRRRARNKSRALCAVCSHDLRATPDRCPECGSTSA